MKVEPGDIICIVLGFFMIVIGVTKLIDWLRK